MALTSKVRVSLIRAWTIVARGFAAAIVACAVLPRLAAAATPEDGRRAYDAGHFTDAMGIWAELSQRGNADAEFGLGLLYDLGNGTPMDPATAFFWYKAAAEAGLPAAAFNVGAMYDSSRGVPQSVESAALWYAKAAAHGHHRAQYDLALLYEQGAGVPLNPAAAVAWMHAAGDGGVTAAETRFKTLASRIPDKPTGALVAVNPVFPVRNAAFALTDRPPVLELVWNAPAEPRPVHYEVQVRELGSTLQTVFTASVTTTAVLVALPDKADFYVWNVDTVGRDGSHAPSDWNWFSVGTPSPSEQSMASMPGAKPTTR